MRPYKTPVAVFPIPTLIPGEDPLAMGEHRLRRTSVGIDGVNTRKTYPS